MKFTWLCITILYEKQNMHTSIKLVRQSAMLQAGCELGDPLLSSVIVESLRVPIPLLILLHDMSLSGISKDKSKNGSCFLLSVPQAKHLTYNKIWLKKIKTIIYYKMSVGLTSLWSVPPKTVVTIEVRPRWASEKYPASFKLTSDGNNWRSSVCNLKYKLHIKHKKKKTTCIKNKTKLTYPAYIWEIREHLAVDIREIEVQPSIWPKISTLEILLLLYHSLQCLNLSIPRIKWNR